MENDRMKRPASGLKRKPCIACYQKLCSATLPGGIQTGSTAAFYM